MPDRSRIQLHLDATWSHSTQLVPRPPTAEHARTAPKQNVDASLGLKVVVKGALCPPCHGLLAEFCLDLMLVPLWILTLRLARCHRLGKECTPSVYIRKRTAKRAGVSRTAQLEEKLDDLVSLLKTQAAAKASDAQTALAHPPPIELYTPVSQQSEESTNGESDRRRALSPDPCAEMAMGTPASILSILPCPGEPTPFQAEQYLNTYRAHMARYLPFTHILPTTTSEELRRQSPFLWLCIMCVACGSTSQQTVLAESVKQIVAKKMVVEGEKSLDLLLGVLIFIGW